MVGFESAVDPTIRPGIAAVVVGRDREIDLILAALSAGRDILLEGPPGTSKSTLLRAITAEWGIPFLLVEGNSDLTASKLIGHHDPSRVLREGYLVDNFVEGPLVRAMRLGGFLYIEELNRAPEDTIDILLSAMAEREIEVPRFGLVEALPSFRLVASMNPFDNIGTTRLSNSIHDRLCRLAISYQDEDAEVNIVRLRATSLRGRATEEDLDGLFRDAVAIVRATRTHPHVRQGSSVRGAIDLALVAHELVAIRAARVDGEGSPTHDLRALYVDTMLDAMDVALSGRIHVDEAAATTPEAVLHEIWEDHFILEPATAAPG